MKNNVILDIKDLCVEFETESGIIRAVDHVGFQVKKAETLGIAGESGCGKTVTAMSILRLLPVPFAKIVKGSVVFDGKDILKLPSSDLHSIRGRKIAMIFQEPMTALNPVHSIGKQIKEVYKLHFPDMSSETMYRNGLDMLAKVGIPDCEHIMKKYPHQLSGGMRQRVMIAMALACRPDILIADEPTTALDVTVQAQILDLINSLREKYGMSVILITHDLGVIAENCNDVIIMYAGRVAEKADVKTLFRHPAHPYTRGLLTSIPSLAPVPKTILPSIDGTVPGLDQMPRGCRFAPRCPDAMDVCTDKIPMECAVGHDHMIACHLAKSLYCQKNTKDLK